ncbi:hypothetical protein ACQKCH_07735 [Nubsella zeaxanthinifaciens]|uniref:hypothetical protein n=1 Tax=Nubsella zeaxanthinifaciens TaxID=392412 RepID=UPI003D02F239
MKKFLFALTFIFAINLACKKIDDPNPICACSPVQLPTLTLVLKDANQLDLLNPNNQGAYLSKDIKLFYLDAAQAEKNVNFYLRTPFSYGSKMFNFYQLHSSDILKMAAENSTQVFTLQVGAKKFKLKITLDDKLKYKVNQLWVNDVSVPMETGEVSSFVPNMFYINAQ